MKEKKAFIFFNCDEEKSQASMNVFYNQEIYRDLKGARKALLSKVESEQAAGRVHIAEADMAAVEQAILAGEPTDASAYIQYGSIESFTII
ncbi:hypothetical protein SAMN02910356_02367 [Selenomonas sp. GACV-9]|uniref:hypothetical protein n=1 Tax=Selenomonas sp. GACV-9 TaxID=3158782 RepID=UPI0008E96ADE|nr:hypothetical protein SAMN02910356_02367 [Selenomonas ruminantium]